MVIPSTVTLSPSLSSGSQATGTSIEFADCFYQSLSLFISAALPTVVSNELIDRSHVFEEQLFICPDK